MSEKEVTPKKRFFRLPDNLAELSEEELENFADYIYMQLGMSVEQSFDVDDDCQGSTLIPDSKCMCKPCLKNRSWR